MRSVRREELNYNAVQDYGIKINDYEPSLSSFMAQLKQSSNRVFNGNQKSLNLSRDQKKQILYDSKTSRKILDFTPD